MGLTLAVIGSDTSTCQLVLRVTRVAEILLIGSGFEQSVCSFMFSAIWWHDLHQCRLQFRSLLAPSDETPTYSFRPFRRCISMALFHVTWYLVGRWNIKGCTGQLEPRLSTSPCVSLNCAPLVVADFTLADGVAQGQAVRMCRGDIWHVKVNCSVSESLLSESNCFVHFFCLHTSEDLNQPLHCTYQTLWYIL